MEKSIENVKRAKSNYYLICYSFAMSFIKGVKKFTSEDVISAYELKGENIPKESRVWGAVIKELHKNNFIKHAGFSKYKKPCGHGKPINVWQSNLNL